MEPQTIIKQYFELAEECFPNDNNNGADIKARNDYISNRIAQDNNLDIEYVKYVIEDYMIQKREYMDKMNKF